MAYRDNGHNSFLKEVLYKGVLAMIIESWARFVQLLNYYADILADGLQSHPYKKT